MVVRFYNSGKDINVFKLGKYAFKHIKCATPVVIQGSRSCNATVMEAELLWVNLVVSKWMCFTVFCFEPMLPVAAC